MPSLPRVLEFGDVAIVFDGMLTDEGLPEIDFGRYFVPGPPGRLDSACAACDLFDIGNFLKFGLIGLYDGLDRRWTLRVDVNLNFLL